MATEYFWGELSISGAFAIDSDDIFVSARSSFASGFIAANSFKDQFLYGLTPPLFNVYPHVVCMRFNSRQKTIRIGPTKPSLVTILADLNIINFLPNIDPEKFLYKSRDGFLQIQGLGISSGNFIEPVGLTGDAMYGIVIDPVVAEQIILTNMDQSAQVLP